MDDFAFTGQFWLWYRALGMPVSYGAVCTPYPFWTILDLVELKDGAYIGGNPNASCCEVHITPGVSSIGRFRMTSFGAKAFCGPAACVYPGVTVQDEAALSAISYTPARTVVKTGFAFLGNPGKPISYKNEYDKAPPGNPALFYCMTSLLAIYRTAITLGITVFFQWLNVNLSVCILLAINGTLLDFNIHGYTLLQVDYYVMTM